MAQENITTLFSEDVLDNIFPSDRSDRFFEALFGDAEEGAFDIRLRFKGYEPERNRLCFEFHLIERPGRCLACNLTYGLPGVFSHHPVIDVRGLVLEIEAILDGRAVCADWELGRTRPDIDSLHVIPLNVTLGH